MQVSARNCFEHVLYRSDVVSGSSESLELAGLDFACDAVVLLARNDVTFHEVV